MSPLDLLPRNLARPVDAQALRDFSTGLEAGDGNGPAADTGDFGSLLEGLAGQSQQDDVKAQNFDGLSTPSFPNEGEPAAETPSDIAGAVFVLLEGFLPRALPQAETLPSAAQGHPDSDDALSLALQEMQQPQSESDLAKSPLPPRMMVSVQHQETHFRPVLENSDTSLSVDSAPGAEVDSGNIPSDLPLDCLPSAALSRDVRPSNDSAIRNPSTLMTAASPLIKSSDVAEEQAGIATFEKLETSKPHSSDGKHVDLQGLAPTALQQLANALEKDLKALQKDIFDRSPQVDGAPRNISIKASESALRVLNLQLHPAELGTVTVKMKLAGDTLQMELHVEKEETAQLLKHDSEKLSTLLRGSGYRPDVISIQVADGAAPDRSSASKPQMDMQFQGQSFSQGGTRQDERSRTREEAYVSARSEQNNNADGDPAVERVHRGGLYL